MHNIRDWTRDRHRTTDDYPFGGGVGMVINLSRSVMRSVIFGPRTASVVIHHTSSGCLTIGLCRSLPRRRLILLCGHYEAWMSVLASWWWTGRSPSATMC